MRLIVLIAVLLTAAACTNGGAHSAAPIADTESGTPIVIGESYTMMSGAMGETRTYNVWLPPSYDEGGKTYPVLYLIDGGADQDFHHITGLTHLGGLWGMFQEVIVVGVATTDRQNELTFPVDLQEYRDEFPTHGHNAEFRAFITDELMPKINKKYRTNGSNGLIGESLAGLFIVDTFLKAPEKFDTFIAISPSVWWDEGSLGALSAKSIAALPPVERKIYLAIADEGGEMRTALLQIVGQLQKQKKPGLAWVFSDRPDLQHSTIYHREANEALNWAYPLPPKKED